MQQQRIQGSLCLGCGSSEHWLRDCPVHSVQNAQLTTATVDGLTLDAEGAVASIWMLSAIDNETSRPVDVKKPDKESVVFELPSLDEFEAKMFRQPSCLLQYCEGQSFAYMIADTGCQRQVAGDGWHALEISPLKPVKHPDGCRFSFGPGHPLPSLGRYAYPGAIAGHPLTICISSVRVSAPALMSKKAFESLGAVPDMHTGSIYFRALDCTTDLWLSPCGHLAVRLDEWSSEEFPWPPSRVSAELPDVIHPWSFEGPSPLKVIDSPAKPVPHASSRMASALAAFAEEPPDIRLLREADGAALLGHDAAASPEGHDPPYLQHPKFGIDLADYHGGADSSGPDARNRVHQEAREVHTSFRTSGLRCSGSESSHLRSVRHEVCPQQGGPTNIGNTESITNGANTLEHPRQRPQRDPRQTRATQRCNMQRGSKRSIPRILAALLNLLAGICAPTTTTTSAYIDGHLIENANFAAESSGEDSPKASPDPPARPFIHTASEAVALRRRQWRGSDSDRMSTGTGVYHSDMDWTEA